MSGASSEPWRRDAPVLIVGAGLSGLACAGRLNEAGVRCILLEQSDRVGGRVRTTERDGFLLDHGFQVLLTAYPVLGDVVDLSALELHRFKPGAIVHVDGRPHAVTDPLRDPLGMPRTLLAPVAGPLDAVRLGRMIREARGFDRPTLRPTDASAHRSIADELGAWGFSDRLVERFFRPFLGGIFLDRSLATSAAAMHFVMNMFARGDAALPAGGMEALPRQMARRLTRTTVHCHQAVAEVVGCEARTTDGRTHRGSDVVLAVDAPAARRLLATRKPQPVADAPAWRSTVCFYFAAPRPPYRDPLLMLNGDGDGDGDSDRNSARAAPGPINNLAVLSNVAPTYAPQRQSLVSVTVVPSEPRAEPDLDRLGRQVTDQLLRWFGPDVHQWRLLEAMWIPHALPDQSPAAADGFSGPTWVDDGLILAGDAVQQGSLEGAIVSGRAAADMVLVAREARETGDPAPTPTPTPMAAP